MANENKKKYPYQGYKTDILNILPELTAQGNFVTPQMIGLKGDLNFDQPTMNKVQASNWTPKEGSSYDEYYNTDQPAKPNAGDYASLLRFAPAVGSLVNWLDKDEPAEINLKKQAAAERLIPGRINQAMLDANLASSYGRAVGDITNVSGGSGAAARANLQGLNIGSAKARAKAFSDLNMANIQNQMRADMFNIGNQTQIGARNVGITNQESLINMQNQLAAEAKKEADRNAFFNSLGQIGVEQFQGNVIGAANTGYGTDIFGRSTYKG